MTVKLGLLALLEAKPGKGDDLAAFLESGRALAAAEEGTVTWYAFKTQRHQLRHLRHLRNRRRPPGPHQRRDPQGTRTVAPEPARHDPDIRPIDLLAVK